MNILHRLWIILIIPIVILFAVIFIKWLQPEPYIISNEDIVKAKIMANDTVSEKQNKNCIMNNMTFYIIQDKYYSQFLARWR